MRCELMLEIVPMVTMMIIFIKRWRRRQRDVAPGVEPWVCHGQVPEARNAVEDGTAIVGCFASASSSLGCS